MELKLTVFSDIHIRIHPSPYVSDAESIMTPLERFQLILSEARHSKADILLNLGDFCNSFESDNEKIALDLWHTFSGTKIAVLGNHDSDLQSKENYVEKMGMPSPYYRMKLSDMWEIIVLDSGNPTSLIDQDQMGWFRETLLAVPKFCIVAIHGAVWRPVSPVYREVIAKANQNAGYTKISAFLFGHTHHTSVTVADGGTRYVEINSPSMRYDTTSRFYRSVPFANMTLYDDGNVTVNGFGEKNSWAVSSDETWVPTDDLTYQASV